MARGKKLNVTLKRSVIGTLEDHRATVKGLGLKHINQTVVLPNTPSIRGMVKKVLYLLDVREEK
ncbi:MAG: 50S ribosomal protein L30 [Deltaproteobacteria bacterium RIFCSPHIGHO2_12_FULL_43_9]|nr:MAG: 50S ribosomal protein L30 [Deltaproteobacteria bacterium RIFCSPHIGHO2_12_FULL_43_9]